MSTTPGSLWTEHKNAQGRSYWYHQVEKRSVWEKPSELKTPRERALDSTPWKEYKAGERYYYVHSVTKESTWTLPPEVKRILDQYPEDGVSSPHLPRGGSATPASIFSGVQSPQVAQSPRIGASPAHSPYVGPGMSPVAGPSSAAVSSAPTSALPHRPNAQLPSAEVNFRGDKEAAEAAFIQLLENTKVDVDWTWETTMRATITDPLYKALKTIAERKAAFNKYIDDLRRRRAEESAARQEELKPLFRQAMMSDSRIKWYSSFPTVQKFLADTPVWKEVKSEQEARNVVDAVLKDMKQEEKDREQQIRKRNMDMLMSLLKTFEADVYTRWRDAHRTIIESQEYAEDAHLSKMDMIDMIRVFEDLMIGIEKEAEEAKKRELHDKKRRERKNRDAYKAVLNDLKNQGKIHAKSTWGQVFPLLKDDDRFLRVCGQPGSTPLDMFYDLVDDLDQELEKEQGIVLDHLKSKGHEVTISTSEEDFLTWAKDSGVETEVLSRIFSSLITELKMEQERQEAEERRKLERKYRHQIEDLRYAFKKVEPALDLEADYDTVVDKVSHLEEFKSAVQEDEQIPRWAWEKFVRRQKEKEKERSLVEEGQSGGGADDSRESTSSRKRKEYPDQSDRRNGSGVAAKTMDLDSATPPTHITVEAEDEARKRVRRDDESEPEEGEV